MPMYRDNVLALDRHSRPRVARADAHRRADRDPSDDGALIFCGISLVLLIVALWAAASGHAEIPAAMF
ncbi:MAG TPA: hypothetical protein VKY22_07140 [Bradyrhizobium sp.]|jgi:hypothetical protein|nr:hypothetical protein [Bradyrhizobium sp.]